MTDAERVVRDQVDAFNARDLEAFLASYAADAVVAGVASIPLVGESELRGHYADRFRARDASCDILTFANLGNDWVVAHERLTASGATFEVVAVFEVAAGKIVRSTSLRRPAVGDVLTSPAV